MNLAPRDRLIAFSAAAVLIVIVLIVVLVVPQFGKLGDLSAQIATAEQESDAARTLLDQRRQVKDNAAITDQTLIQLANAVPENPELPSLIIEIQDTAYASGVLVRSVTPNPPVQSSPTAAIQMPMELQVAGTWADTVDFLQQLQKLTRQVRIVDFTSEVMNLTDASSLELKTPPYYPVGTTIRLETYVIPAASATGSSTAAPAAPAPAP